jgi:hypothetical protein
VGRYSDERKEAVLRKMLPPHSPPIAALAAARYRSAKLRCIPGGVPCASRFVWLLSGPGAASGRRLECGR